MLNSLIRFSLAQRALVLALAALVLFLGIRKALELPVDVLPDLTKPTVTILTESSGYAPEEVEALVTVPLETALQGVQGVTRTRAINDISLSLLCVTLPARLRPQNCGRSQIGLSGDESNPFQASPKC